MDPLDYCSRMCRKKNGCFQREVGEETYCGNPFQDGGKRFCPYLGKTFRMKIEDGDRTEIPAPLPKPKFLLHCSYEKKNGKYDHDTQGIGPLNFGKN